MAIKVNRGTTYAITVNYTVDGAPADLTGATILFTAKTTEFDSDLTDSSAVIAKTITTHSDPTAGISLITLDPADTQSLDPDTEYRYDIKVVTATGDVYKLNEGVLKIDGSPTNRIA